MKIAFLLVITLVSTFAGCATTSVAISNPPSDVQLVYQSVHIVNHGGNSADMDANMQREFLTHGFVVKAGADEGGHGGADLIVRYADDWKWDIAMYLRSLDLMVYNAQAGSLIATGRWKNSAFHGFYSSEKVVTQVVNDTLVRANILQQ